MDTDADAAGKSEEPVIIEPALDLDALDYADEARMTVRHPATDEPMRWIWTFYGPGHARSIEIASRRSRQALREAEAKEQAQANGRKWKVESRSLEEVRTRNIGDIVDRVKFWTPVRLNGVHLEFSIDATKKLLLDARKGWLLLQIGEFLADNASFTRTSATG